MATPWKRRIHSFSRPWYRLGRAGCGQDMDLDPGAPSECGDRRTSIAAKFGRPGNDLPERARDANGVEPRQDGIDGRAGAVAGDDDWDLLRRQTPLGGLAAPLARGSRQIPAFALEGFEDEGLVRLDDPGQAQRLVEIERGQEPMSPPERGGVGHLAAFRGLRDRLAGDQRPRLVRPAILVMQAGQRRPGQRVECLPAARAAVPRLAASLAPGMNLIPTAVRTAKATNPTPPDLRQQVFLRRGSTAAPTGSAEGSIGSSASASANLRNASARCTVNRRRKGTPHRHGKRTPLDHRERFIPGVHRGDPRVATRPPRGWRSVARGVPVGPRG